LPIPNERWEGPGHYKFWAQYLDEDYDPDCDVEPARLYVAFLLREKNPATAAECVVNCDVGEAPPWLIEWVGAWRGDGGQYQFAREAEEQFGGREKSGAAA
jgi:hypothetical protein